MTASLVKLTTVVTPASSYLLSSVAIFKSDLQISGTGDDTYIARLLAQASSAVSNYCNRVFAAEEVLDEIWPAQDPYPFQTPGGVDPLQLTRWPIVGVISVLEAGVALVEGVDYRIAAQRGHLIRLNSSTGYPCPWQPVSIAVDYIGGYDPIPDDIADAVSRMMRAKWFARSRDPQVRSENIAGVYEASYWFGAGPGSKGGGMPPDIEDLLDNYRVPVVG